MSQACLIFVYIQEKRKIKSATAKNATTITFRSEYEANMDAGRQVKA